ncbi:hypothetical protein [Azospirillum sp. sgz302134]
MIAVYPLGWLSQTADDLQKEAQEDHQDPELEVYEGWETAFLPGAHVVDFRSYASGAPSSPRWRGGRGAGIGLP